MGYYVRVLSTRVDCVPASVLQSAIKSEKLKARLSIEEGPPNDWKQLVLSHGDGVEIACIERNVVEDGSLGAEELAEFRDEVANCKPASAAKWLLEYFPRIRCIYAFQLLSGTDHKNGWDVFAAVKNRIWSAAPSILQADNEGFSNEHGYHILWQFNEAVEGNWWMGILRGGHWKHFEMDLGSRKHREAFLQGQIPDGAKLAD